MGKDLASGLSPCTLPTAVFVVGYVGGYAEKSKLRGFALALAFVLGLSLTLAAMGAAAALAGSLFLESDVLWYMLSLVLLLMGFNLLGLFKLPDLPGLNLKATGTRGFLVAFLLGIPFAFAALPCTTPVTAGVLAYAAGKGSAFYGFILLFVYALGRSLPLLVVGTFTGLVKKWTGCKFGAIFCRGSAAGYCCCWACGFYGIKYYIKRRRNWWTLKCWVRAAKNAKSWKRQCIRPWRRSAWTLRWKK
ncbi:cytochrome c biogenesis CcdA family protein [Desulfoscipio geothermicus]|uniref:cytochrome c biogenesis CcdA family protein n=1 Tax=Desulfoscipio geothermicus TaxID=39060 RepID=UPI002481EFF3|nr:cytochrome c biogenesis protein CcdA [Desulfoscipio geothermicus]